MRVLPSRLPQRISPSRNTDPRGTDTDSGTPLANKHVRYTVKVGNYSRDLHMGAAFPKVLNPPMVESRYLSFYENGDYRKFAKVMDFLIFQKHIQHCLEIISS